MVTLIIGGSNSGKSEYAESLLDKVTEKKYYIATMMASDEESIERVKKHRQRREGRSFVTVECPVDLGASAELVPGGSTVLLECIGNLAANEFFRFYRKDWIPEKEADAAKSRILEGIRILCERSDEVVIVSNEVNRAGCDYEGDTLLYQKLIGELNQELVRISDRVVEMVYGMPVYRQGDGLEKDRIIS